MLSSFALTLGSSGFFFLYGAVLIAALVTTGLTIHNYRTHLQVAEERLRILGSLDELNRWCSRDFPVVGEVTVWLRMQINQEDDGINVSNFRGELRQKYLSRPDRVFMWRFTCPLELADVN